MESKHAGELGEPLRQLDRLGLGETVVGEVEVVVNGVGVGAVLNGNKVVVGSGEVCDACVVAALSGGTEEIAKFWYGKLETCLEIAGMDPALLQYMPYNIGNGNIV